MKVDRALRLKSIPQYLVRMIRSFLSVRSLEIGGGFDRDPRHRQITSGGATGICIKTYLMKPAFRQSSGTPNTGRSHPSRVNYDVSITVVTGNVELIEQVANLTLQRVVDWIVEHGLRLASEKT